MIHSRSMDRIDWCVRAMRCVKRIDFMHSIFCSYPICFPKLNPIYAGVYAYMNLHYFHFISSVFILDLSLLKVSFIHSFIQSDVPSDELSIVINPCVLLTSVDACSCPTTRGLVLPLAPKCVASIVSKCPLFDTPD